MILHSAIERSTRSLRHIPAKRPKLRHQAIAKTLRALTGLTGFERDHAALMIVSIHPTAGDRRVLEAIAERHLGGAL
jgi:hypothetical protein